MHPRPGIIHEREGASEAVHSSRFTLGRERRAPHDDGWGSAQFTGASPLLAFSLAPVRVRFHDDAPVILSPAVVATPGRSSEYVRQPVTPEGQRTVWFIIRDDTLARLASTYDPGAMERPEDPVRGWVAPADPHAAVLARKLERYAFNPDAPPDPLLLEESMIRVAELSVRTIYASRGAVGTLPRRPSARSRRMHLDAIATACEHICLNSGEALSLAEISDIAELSPGYLCRVFREHLGMSVHQYLTRVRVLDAVDQLPSWRGRLSALARRSGFSSHAHLVTAFQRLLGVSPSDLDADDAGRWLERTTPFATRAGLRRRHA